ncbi:carboxyl-terminal processing protease [Fluviicoccus keumensis]|uniref:Carboxyl-terminal processing protease n=2 Tax=Fluviicoccus keumensis TaxID=1435465 RepID=A0A4Q7YP21_9GAMM|nr:carboxyl-terminal processing protease [Fluviicoccus keumensis]
MKKLSALALALLAFNSAAMAGDETAAAPVPTPAAATAAEAAPSLPLDDLRTFVDVFERIRASYVEPVDDRTMFENAIRGMLTALDPHSAYLNENDYDDLKAATTGEFGGIGVEIGMDDGMLRVISPIDDTPAAKAGVQAGDYILKLEGKLVKGLSLNQAVDLMRGPIGQPLHMTLQRKGRDPWDVSIVRNRIEVTSVKVRELEPGFAAIRISQFQTRTGRDLVKELIKLKNNTASPLKGLVLDLRNNPGGVLPAAIDVADAFLDKALVVYTKGRTEESIQRYEAQDGQVIPGIPLVVLVNGGSASASEIVAGALQDQHRALIAGTTTFGKGSVQTVLPISDKKGIKLTTARYYTPSGRSIQAEGIRPDVVLEPAKHTLIPSNDNFKEADLVGHLANPNGAAVDKPSPAATPTSEAAAPAAEPAAAKPVSGKKSRKAKPGPASAPTPAPAPAAAPAVDSEEVVDGVGDAKPTDKATPKPLAESDFVMYGALNLLKGALFWQPSAAATVPAAAVPASAPVNAKP